MLLVNVEGGIEIGAIALVAGVAPLGQGGVAGAIVASLVKLDQLGG